MRSEDTYLSDDTQGRETHEPAAAAASSTEETESFTLASELGSVDRVESTALRYARRAGFDEDTCSHIAMTAREASVNAVMHGNRYDPAKEVHVCFALSAAQLTIQVADEGAGFDADTVPNPLEPENLMRTSGRGIFLMRALMDEVHLRQLNPGTEITLVKRRPTTA